MIGGKQAGGLPDGMLLPPLIDTGNTSGVTIALPTF